MKHKTPLYLGTTRFQEFLKTLFAEVFFNDLLGHESASGCPDDVSHIGAFFGAEIVLAIFVPVNEPLEGGAGRRFNNYAFCLVELLHILVELAVIYC